MNIPFLDLGAAYRELQTEIDVAVARVLASGYYIGGPEVEAFEEEFATYCGSTHAIGVANGLDALHLALRALDVGPGDEVIVPSNTYIATWLAVSQCGATPVPVEPDARTYNIDPALTEAAITPRTKVILPVHLYGQPADMDEINAIAARHNATAAQVTLAWAMQLGYSVIPSSTRRANLESNLKACALKLTDEDMAQIAALDRGHRLTNPQSVAPEWD